MSKGKENFLVSLDQYKDEKYNISTSFGVLQDGTESYSN